jgi:hypothetical protein
MSEIKLDNAQKHILRLIHRDKDSQGWTKVSEALCKTVRENIPSDLATFEKLEDGGRVKLTEEGNGVILAMAYL